MQGSPNTYIQIKNNEIFMIDLINYKYEVRENFYRLLVLITIIIIVNISTLSSLSGLLITIPQYIIVVFLLIKGDIKNSVLWHMTFMILSLSAQGTLGMFDDETFSLYNYGTIKLIGPIRCCYVMNIFFVLLLKSKKTFHNESLFSELYKTFLIVFSISAFIGFVGCVVHPYYLFSDWINNLVYVFAVLSTCYILLKLSDPKMYRSAYYICTCALMGSVIGSYICFKFLDVVSNYSVYEIPYVADLTFFAPLLIVGILTIKPKIPLYISLLIYMLLVMEAMGGKTVFGILFAFLIIVYLSFFDRYTFNKYGINIRKLRLSIMFMSIFIVLYVIKNFSSDSMAYYKVMSAMSMAEGNLDDMGDSPYIRVASLINILNEGIKNPFILFLGNGYGGYFEDGLNLFAGIDLSNGAWKDDNINTGRFYSGHDTMVTVPLFNGLLGLYMILRICWYYIKRININYMNATAIFWIILVFYYNTIFVFIGSFYLFASEYKEEN